ncbi:MAG: PDZ domain-containing protein [Myxococcales bacterium]|nr:PDZ domain-containing protein [Myxococcales bacterium]
MIARYRALALLAPLTVACSPFHVDGPADCSMPEQNEYVYDVLEKVYLWNDTLPPRDSLDFEAFEGPEAVLNELRYRELDRWSYITEKEKSDALFDDGRFVGYGFSYKRDDGKIRVSGVHDGSPADLAGLRRGDELVTINSFNIAQIDQDEMWGDIFGPDEIGVESTIEIKDADGEQFTVTIARDWIDIITVPNVAVLDGEAGPVGYLTFGSFIGDAKDELDDAWDAFNDADITTLVVDLRYNGGGSVSIAEHLIDLIAGARTHGDGVAYRVEYNDDLSDEDEDHGMSNPGRSIDLDHVTFITTGRSLSASELVINAVRAHMPISVVGDTTGGKPVGMKRYTFCDQVLFPITFRVLNADGEGDYYDGIEPDCFVEDDLDHELGDPAESSLAAALSIMQTGACPAEADASSDQDGAMFDDDPLVKFLRAR